MILKAQTVRQAYGHAYSKDWLPAANDRHTRECIRYCDHKLIVLCELLTATIDETPIHICPICGRTDPSVTAVQQTASIDWIQNHAKYQNIVSWLAPAPQDMNCIAVLSIVCESDGKVVVVDGSEGIVHISFTDALPEAFRLVHVDAVTQAQTELSFTLEDNILSFTTDQWGLFLLLPLA